MQAAVVLILAVTVALILLSGTPLVQLVGIEPTGQDGGQSYDFWSEIIFLIVGGILGAAHRGGGK